MAPKNQRGQSLLLFALTLLLLTLMVFLTLSIGMKTREKMELQIAADAAAYSNAVATARTYNTISILNRLQVSYWVSMAASQSLVSWTGYARGMLTQGSVAAQIISNKNREVIVNGVCVDQCTPCDDALETNGQILSNELEAANIAIDSDWEDDDKAAGKDILNIQGIIAGLRNETETYSGVNRPGSDAPGGSASLVQLLENQTLAGDIATLAARGSPVPGEITARQGMASQISLREVDCTRAGSFDPSGNGSWSGAPGICSNPDWNDRMLQAAMGSRGNSFVRSRGVVPPNTPVYDEHVPSIELKLHTIDGNVEGSGHWGLGREDFTGTRHDIAWGEDHGIVRVTVNEPSIPGCSEPYELPVRAWVKSTDIDDPGDEHFWTGETESDANPDHTMGSCGNSCPSVWVRALKFQHSDETGDLWGQPKNYAVLERNYAARTGATLDPWNLLFRFRFTEGGEGEVFDNRGIRLGNGTDISRQVAVATGLTYYHRYNHWSEFPNFLNPFWRATLVAADADTSAKLEENGEDIARLLGEQDWQEDTYRRLHQAGFRGFH